MKISKLFAITLQSKSDLRNRVYYDGAWWNVDITTDNSRTANGKELYGFHKLEGAFVPDEDFFTVAGVSVLLMHGHLYGVKHGLGAALSAGKAKNADIVVSGNGKLGIFEKDGVKVGMTGYCFPYKDGKKDITKEEFRKSIEENTLLDYVNRVKVKKGDIFFIEAGTLHAICKGILLAERFFHFE